MSSVDRKMDNIIYLRKYNDEEIKMWQACFNLEYYSKYLRYPLMPPIVEGVCRNMIKYNLPLCTKALQSEREELRKQAEKSLKKFSKSGYLKTIKDTEIER